MNAKAIIQRLAALADDPASRRVYGAPHHGWQLEPVWSSEELTKFERAKRVELPEAYRQWLLEVGRAGAGPGNGLFLPGTWSDGGPPEKWTGRRFGPLSTPFPHGEAVDRHRGKLPGAMPISDLGCGIKVLLVTAGPQAGRIWIDDRANRCGLVPEDDLAFDAWIEAWLSAAEQEAAEPFVSPPQHPNEPDQVRPASELVDERDLDALVEAVRAALDPSGDGPGEFPTHDQVGRFRRRGQSVGFEQGPGIQRAIEEGRPLPGSGPVPELIRAVIRMPPWVGIEIPGLCRIWVREKKRIEMRDYLGRQAWTGDSGLFLTVQTQLRF